jgi:hypothetical protein
MPSQESFLNSEIIASFRPGAAANTAELPELNALVKHFPSTPYRRKGRVFSGLPRIGRKSYGTEGASSLADVLGAGCFVRGDEPLLHFTLFAK